MPPLIPTPDTVELPPTVTAELGALGRAILDVEDPLLRLAVIRSVENRVELVLATVRTLAIRDAREERHPYRVVGEAYGVSEQRAHQLARLTTEEDPTT